MGNATNATTVATVSPTTVNQVTIDSTWISNHASVGTGGTMYVLDQANTIYTLATDVTTTGTAFVVGAANVTLNLNGHTVTYDNSAPIAVYNSNFALGSGTNVPGWNVSGARNASLVPMTGYMPGTSNQMLELSNFSTPQTITSSQISIPTANRTYVATITPAHAANSNTAATLSVIDAVTGQVLASGSSPDVNRGFSAVARFIPTTTHAVYLRVTVTPPTGGSDTVDLGYASLSAADDYGILVSQLWSGQMSAYANLSPLAQQEYIRAANFAVENGSLVQGQAHGYASNPFFAEYMSGLSVYNVTTQDYGIDTQTLDAYTAGGGIVVRNSTFRESVDNITDRMSNFATLALTYLQGPAFVDNNQILGSPQCGIVLANNNPQYRITISNNTIQQHAIVTNGYGISIAALQNFEIAHNTITPTNGRGITIDGYSSTPVQNGLVHDNYVSVQEAYNREYWLGGTGIEARALRLRNNVDAEGQQRNLAIYNNTFIATTGAGLVQYAYGVRLSYVNPNGEMNNAGISLVNNLIKAIVTTTDTTYHAYALQVAQLDPGIGLNISNNVLESNDVSLSVSGDDGWNVSGVDFVADTLRLSSSGATRAYAGVAVGYWIGVVTGVRLIDTRVDNGATLNFAWSGSGTKDVSVCSLLDVAALGSSGAFLSGATVTVTNNAGAQVFTGTTGADGQSSNIIVATVLYRQTTTDPTQISTTLNGPFTIAANFGASSTSQVVNLTGDLAEVLTIPGA
jgi:hypothetical protein